MRTRLRHLAVGLILFVGMMACSESYSQETAPTIALPSAEAETPASESDDRPTIESIESQINELAPQIEAAAAAAAPETVQRIGVSLDALTGRAERLRSLSSVLQQQISALTRLAELEETQAETDIETASLDLGGIEEVPPYSVTLADRFHDAMLSEQRNFDSLVAAVESIETELESAKERLEDAERARRAAREAAEGSNEPVQSQRLAWELNRAILEERYLRESVTVREFRLDVAEAERDLSERRLEAARNRSDAIRQQAVFSRTALEERLADITTRRDAVERTLPELRDTHQTNEALRRAAREALQASQGEAAIASATANLAMRTAHVDSSARAVELAEKKLSLFDQERVLWERRFAVWRDAGDAELTEWRDDTAGLLEEWKRDRNVQESRLIDLRTTILDIEQELANWNDQRGARSVAESQLQALRDREASINEYLAALLPLERLAARLHADIEREVAHVTFGERWERIQRFLGSVWNFELFVFSDSSVSVSKIVIAFLIVVIGIIAVRFFTRTMRERLLVRTPLNDNAAAAVEKLTYYAGIVIIVLYALNFVNIPLTLFAFFGGAIAIAVGFGAQHIINNFISGFILMLERPIRIGDLVEVNGVYGHIRHIGARSTRLHMAENIDLLIPNSQLLENVVTNWTLTDEKLRTSVAVGVMYGSPTDLVTELLIKATNNSKRVLDSPKPIILFADFGDNALSFEVHFWVKMRGIMDKRQVESEVRYNIDRLFRENDIVIAFPQRDIHFDSGKPLDIRMISDKEPS